MDFLPSLKRDQPTTLDLPESDTIRYANARTYPLMYIFYNCKRSSKFQAVFKSEFVESPWYVLWRSAGIMLVEF
jgi:hypothetical protein